MIDFKLYDGTRNSVYGETLLEAIQDIAIVSNNQIQCEPRPGAVDIDGFNLVKLIEQYTLRAARGQILIDHALEIIDSIPEIRKGGETKIFLFEEDTYSNTCSNWCFGGFVPHNGKKYVLISMARINDKIHLKDVFDHELAHSCGVPRPKRRNTYYHLGGHCSNDLCVMRQNDDLVEARKYAYARHNARAPPFCRQCTTNQRFS